MAASPEMVDLQRVMLHDAVTRGELGPDAEREDQALYLVSTMISGVITQAMANEPEIPWGEGRFTPAFPRLIRLLPAAFPPRSLIAAVQTPARIRIWYAVYEGFGEPSWWSRPMLSPWSARFVPASRTESHTSGPVNDRYAVFQPR